MIKKAGLLSTVQDLGRLGSRRFGINPNGPMDPVAARIGNILVGNDDNAAFLELHFPAGEFEFETDAIFAICGGDFGAELDGSALTPWRAYSAQAGSILAFNQKRSGERCYLAIRGFSVPLWLDSASTNLSAHIGGFEGRQLASGDRLAIRPHSSKRPHRLPAVSPSLLPPYSKFPKVRIVRGAEFEELCSESRDSLTGQDFTISRHSNRMGFRLSGQSLSLAKPQELISSAVCFGTMQLLPDGQVIILMADQQTAGGYPRVAHIITCDLPLVGQLGAGDKLAFHLVELDEAERLIVQFEEELSFLRTACRLAYK